MWWVAVAMLDAWLAWARRCQIPAFVELYDRIKEHRAGIVTHGLTESVNTKLRLLTRMAYGFCSPTTSSPSASSTEAATAHPYQAEMTHGPALRA